MGTRVFVGGLTYRVRERDIEKFFRKYGRIKEVAMKNGFAFVEFDDYRDADDAVYELNGKELLGERVSVERARGTPRGSDQWRGGSGGGGRGYGPPRGRSRDKYGPPTRTEHRLIVENLSSRVSWQDLKDYMRQAGEVTYADAHKQRRNEGVVEFASYSDMKNAIEKLDDTELNGRHIRLVEDRRRVSGGGGGGAARRSRSSSSRSRSRSRSRRRSRSRSRSRSRRSSHSRSRSNRFSRSKSRDRDRSKSKSPQRSKSHSRSKSKEPSKSPQSRSRSHSIENNGKARSHSRSRSISKDRDRSKSRSKSPATKDDDMND